MVANDAKVEINKAFIILIRFKFISEYKQNLLPFINS